MRAVVAGLLPAAHDFFAGFKENFHFAIAAKSLHEANSEAWMLDGRANSVIQVHMIVFGGKIALGIFEVGPLLRFDGRCIADPFRFGWLAHDLGWSVAMRALAGIALYLDRFVASNRDDHVIGDVLAFGAPGINDVSGRRCGFFHGVPLRQ